MVENSSQILASEEKAIILQPALGLKEEKATVLQPAPGLKEETLTSLRSQQRAPPVSAVTHGG